MKRYFYIIGLLLIYSKIFSQTEINEEVKINIKNAYHSRGFVEVAFDMVNNTSDTLRIFSLSKRDRKKDFRAVYNLSGFEEPGFEILIKSKMLHQKKNESEDENYSVFIGFEEYENPIFLRNKYSVVSIPPNDKKSFSVIKEIRNYHRLVYDSLEVSAQFTYNTSYIKKKEIKKMKGNIIKDIKKTEKLIEKEFKTKDEIKAFRKKCYNLNKLTDNERELCKLIFKNRNLKSSKMKILNHIKYLSLLSKINVKSEVFIKRIKI